MINIPDIGDRKTRFWLCGVIVVSSAGLTGGLPAAIAAIAAIAGGVLSKDIYHYLSQHRGKKMIDSTTAIQFLEELSVSLDDIDRDIIRGVWERKSYKEIHKLVPGITLEHLQRNRASQLLGKLSQTCGEKVKKSNLKSAIVKAMKQQNTSLDIEKLVQKVRRNVSHKIEQDCGTMRVLDMKCPIGLDDIYTQVNILKKVHQRFDPEQLSKQVHPEKFDRLGLGAILEKEVPGMEAVERHNKLLALGKPGAGKTTFLKHLAIQCNGGKFQSDRVPIFVTLRYFADQNYPSLFAYLQEKLENCQIKEQELLEVLKQGKALILLDGLDEVNKENSDRVNNKIREFYTTFEKNWYVMTCRIAAQEYMFELFTEVEVADFKQAQIEEFSHKWFQTRVPEKATKLIQEFKEKLAGEQATWELASSPLLLTLLCLVFEELRDFPKHRSALYKEGLELLLKKWDSKRGIKRDPIYKDLSTQQREDLLSNIALTTFEQGKNFFAQREVEQYIVDYIRSLPDAQTDPKELQLDSEAVLKSIEAQHGILVERFKHIYSFSHLTFHEYFTAQAIVNSSNPKEMEEGFMKLLTKISDRQWREVFLLTVEMLRDSSNFLQMMSQHIHQIVSKDSEIQKILNLNYEKTQIISQSSKYDKAAIRAFYLARVLDDFGHFIADTKNLEEEFRLDFSLINSLHLVEKHNTELQLKVAKDVLIGLDAAIDPTMKNDLRFLIDYNRSTNLENAVNNTQKRIFLDEFSLAINLAKNLNLKQELQSLQNKTPELLSRDLEMEKIWENKQRLEWAGELRNTIIKYRGIGHRCILSEQQWMLFKNYSNANLLLVDCLNQCRYISREVREEIEETLLLPIAEIKKRNFPSF
ncbi:NACHT domain-containing protein [Spirulina sp. 06S082]|uniref:NACHT domain-containing protein n=1 Tax=Spirulina sp. 06S082 TaxID=3110248 RepID=UPI002B21660B|nr:NACHT domain-containing protein [Spirulina sp. 06S082]MEA5469913.1 NACHT domain-containing protein [Spirulina sp. 06S082]